MRHTEGRPGRVFVLRLEDGEVLHEVVEAFCREHGVAAASFQALGGAASGSRLVVGPEDGTQRPVTAAVHELSGVHELAAVGTVFPDESGAPVLHAHACCGRRGRAVAGCVRAGVITWEVIEAVLTEIADARAVRRHVPEFGFATLFPAGA